jgi:polysaccharide export outer membrane protein
MLHSLIAAVLATLLPQAPAPAPPAGQTVHQAYVIGAGDVLAIKVLDEAELSREYAVDADGTITFPFLNRLAVAGKTVKDVETELTTRLSPAWLRNPQVAVAVSQYRSRYIFVLGEVKNPAKYAIEGNVSLLEVIAKAGYFTPTAGSELRVLRSKEPSGGGGSPAMPDDERTTVVLRVNIKDLTDGKVQSNILLQDGDTLLVPSADRFYVAGFVRNPGQFVLTPGLTVRQALAMAGGLSERGSDRGISITRIVNGKEVKIDANFATAVQPGDTIYFRQRRI